MWAHMPCRGVWILICWISSGFFEVAAKGRQGCFLPHSLVTLDDGTRKPIGNVTPGDLVLSWDSVHGRPVTARVLRLHWNVRRYLIKIHLPSHEVVFATVDHPFWSWRRQGVVSRSPLSTHALYGLDTEWLADNEIFEDESGYPVAGSVVNVDLESDHNVVTLELEHFHWFYVQGIRVHNKEGQVPVSTLLTIIAAVFMGVLFVGALALFVQLRRSSDDCLVVDKNIEQFVAREVSEQLPHDHGGVAAIFAGDGLCLPGELDASRSSSKSGTNLDGSFQRKMFAKHLSGSRSVDEESGRTGTTISPNSVSLSEPENIQESYGIPPSGEWRCVVTESGKQRTSSCVLNFEDDGIITGWGAEKARLHGRYELNLAVWAEQYAWGNFEVAVKILKLRDGHKAKMRGRFEASDGGRGSVELESAMKFQSDDKGSTNCIAEELPAQHHRAEEEIELEVPCRGRSGKFILRAPVHKSG